MSAAAPVPPPPPQHAPGTVSANTSPTSNGNGRDYVYAHIEDLKTQATTGFNPSSSVKSLVETAEKSLVNANALLQWRRPDSAFVDFTRSFEIATNVIPLHSGYIDFSHDDKHGLQRLDVLRRKLIAATEQFLNIKGIIENNNRRYQTLPTRSTAATSTPRDSAIGDSVRPDSRGSSNGSLRYRPTPSPKPQALHGRALSEAIPSPTSPTDPRQNDILMNRFSKLRVNTGQNGAGNRHTVVLGNTSSSAEHDRSARPISRLPGQQYPGQPVFTNGAASAQQPRHSPLNHNGSGIDLPKPPSPTYSPARNMQTNDAIALPRYSVRSLAGNDVRRTMPIPQEYISPAVQSPEKYEDVHGSQQINGAVLGSTVRRSRVAKAQDEKSITAERLYDYLRYFQVLLVDVRSRDQFDLGHIFHRNIMCVEPMTLHQGMSAEQLSESLIIGPEVEQSMFEQRNQFDLVVYYDRDTRSTDFIKNPSTEQESKLKYLYEALCLFNQERPLQAQPMILAGGIEAWCEIAGSQSLALSNTSNRTRNAVQRRPVTGLNRSDLRISKRRLRDYNPLDKEEEQKWMERARQESISAPAPPTLFEADEVAEESHTPQSGNAAIEEFLQRFPDAGMIEHQPGFMVNQMPARTAPQLPVNVPTYPPKPPSSFHPQAPTRPLPAAPRMSYNGVSDRAAPPLLRTSSAMAPYIPPKYMASNLRVPRTGLVNTGITCYLNSTIQALSATTPLSTFFLDDDFRRQVQKENWKGSKGVMPELYSTVIRSLWKGDVEAIKPTTFRNFCGRLNREWSIERQQDAKEFFDFLIDCLHEDLNQRWSQTLLRELTEAEEQQRESMPKTVVAKLEWERYTHREQSFLTTIFGGQHASLLRCKTCGVTSTKHEAFYSISVEIPPPRPQTGTVTLDQCLRSYCAEEMLSGDEVWRCPHCRREREATKQITITRAPQFLVLHFKRFAAGHTTSARKVRTPIEFPLEGLDLEPYMLAQNTPEQTENIAKRFDARFVKSDVTMRPPYIYDAYAVMRHIGQTLTSGHYTCAVKDRNRGCWRMFNDTRVTDFQPEQLGRRDALNNEEAYIVFYARRAAL